MIEPKGEPSHLFSPKRKFIFIGNICQVTTSFTDEKKTALAGHIYLNKRSKMYLHESWFDKKSIKNKKKYRMCQFCGNDNPNVMNCQNCDVGFETYYYIET